MMLCHMHLNSTIEPEVHVVCHMASEQGWAACTGSNSWKYESLQGLMSQTHASSEHCLHMTFAQSGCLYLSSKHKFSATQPPLPCPATFRLFQAPVAPPFQPSSLAHPWGLCLMTIATSLPLQSPSLFEQICKAAQPSQTTTADELEQSFHLHVGSCTRVSRSYRHLCLGTKACF